MKRFVALTMCAVSFFAVSTGCLGQNLGCTFPYADNYDASANLDDNTCIYDLGELVASGTCVSSLLAAGVSIEDLIGLELDEDLIGYSQIRIAHIDTISDLVYYRGSYAGESSWVGAEECVNIEIGGTSTDFGAGQMNTNTIVSSECGSPSAAMSAYNSSFLGFDDWYLPSRDEVVLFAGNGLNFYNTWTSSEYSQSQAYRLIGYGPGVSPQNKNSSGHSMRVRHTSTHESWTGLICGPGCNDIEACNYDAGATLNDGSCDYCSCSVRPQVLVNEWTAAAVLNGQGELTLTTQGINTTYFEYPEEDKKFSKIALTGSGAGTVLAALNHNGDIHIYGGEYADSFRSTLSGTGLNQSWIEVEGARSYDRAFGAVSSLGQAVTIKNGSLAATPLSAEQVWSVRHIDVTEQQVAVALEDSSVWVWNWGAEDASLVELTVDDQIVKVHLTSNYASNAQLGVLTASGEILGLTGSLTPPPLAFTDFECNGSNYCVGITPENAVYSWGTIPFELPITSALDVDLGFGQTAIDTAGNIFYSANVSEMDNLPNYTSIGEYIACGQCNDLDDDGICDDEDPCVGIEDECGVCNGPGATYQCGCDPIEEGECDCFGNVVDDCGICGGDNTTCSGDAECLDDDDSVEALGGCINAIALLGCDALWFGAPLSEICTFACDACPCDSDINDNGICDDSEVLGCTYILADNYNADATLDDGSCLFTCYQETDLQQAYDNGVESVECPEEANNDCATDLDNDGEVATSDLLLFLSTFGDSCD